MNLDSLLLENQRMAYLGAMEIDCWVPNDWTAEGHSSLINVERVNDESKKENEVFIKEVSPKIKPDEVNTKVSSKVADNIVLEHSDKHLTTSNNIDEKNTSSKINNPLEITFSPVQQIKLVNWTVQNLKEEGAKKLLIVCRHQIDQPANSFARTNEPSQFMQDYINSLVALNELQSYDIQIQIAHLAQADLGTKNLSMESYLDSSNTDLVLVLGDETIKQLSHSQTDTASLRGRLIPLGIKQALVSYHPFSMIKNPSLKPLALEDLALVASYFTTPI